MNTIKIYLVLLTATVVIGGGIGMAEKAKQAGGADWSEWTDKAKLPGKETVAKGKEPAIKQTPGTATQKIYNTPYQAEIRQRAGLPADATDLADKVTGATYTHIMASSSDTVAYGRAQRMEQALTRLRELENMRYQVMVWPEENLEQLCRRHPDGEYGCEMYRRDFEAEKPSREKKELEFLEKEKVVVDELRAAYAEFTR
jgi:hypothetical protein